jgi:predicted ester cyclase
MSEANKSLVRQWVDDVFNRRDYGRSAAIVSETHIEHAVGPFGQTEPGQVSGPQHLRETAEWLVAQFPDLHMTIQALVAARILSEGTNLGPLNGVVPPTGKRFAAGQSHWVRVKDGKLAEHWATRDDLMAMLQLGVISPPGRPSS